MTVSFDGWIADAVIASGGTDSRWVEGKYEYSDAVCVNIQSPATLPDTVTIQVSQDGVTAATLADGSGTAISPPAAGKAHQYTEIIGFKFFRLHAGSATAADRTFKLSKQWTV